MRITRTYTVTSETITDIRYAIERRHYRSASDLIREGVRKVMEEIRMKELALKQTQIQGV